MHEAVHWATDYNSQNLCMPGLPASGHASLPGRHPITEFERYSALRNLTVNNSSLGLHLHLPSGQHLTDPALCQSFIQALTGEIALLCRHIPGHPLLQQLHLHGDPSALLPAQLQQVFDCLRQHFRLASNNFAWFNIEICPGHADWSVLGALRDCGFNRINLHAGSQDFKLVQNLYEAARALQYSTITLLLKHDDSLDSCGWQQRLQQLIALQSDRIIIGNLCQSQHCDSILLSQVSCQQLLEAGYVLAGLHSFVLPDDELTESNLLQHHDTLLTHRHHLIGLGPGAHSLFGRLGYNNEGDVSAYIRALASQQLPAAQGRICSDNEWLARTVCRVLEQHRFLDIARLEHQLNTNFQRQFSSQVAHLRELATSGLVSIDTKQLVIHSQDSCQIRQISQLFLPPAIL